MVNRTFWQERVERHWRKRSVLWLSGVRRTGKTCLAQSLPDVEYFDCELPRVRRAMEDPEQFLHSLRGRRIVLDEIHRLANPDLADFRHTDLRHRLLHGGLPPYFHSPVLPEREFQEWMDAYWAKDIQELFRLERSEAG